MKRYSLILLFFGSIIFVSAYWRPSHPETETTIKFVNGTWEDILAKARVENRIVFVDVYATWCGPCKLLKKTTFVNSEVAEFFNANFINTAIDGETKEGLAIMERYDVRAYPTMLFVRPDGTVQKAAVGYHNANQLLKVALSVRVNR